MEYTYSVTFPGDISYLKACEGRLDGSQNDGGRADLALRK